MCRWTGGFQTGIHKRACAARLERFHIDTSYIDARSPESFEASIERFTGAREQALRLRQDAPYGICAALYDAACEYDFYRGA